MEGLGRWWLPAVMVGTIDGKLVHLKEAPGGAAGAARAFHTPLIELNHKPPILPLG